MAALRASTSLRLTVLAIAALLCGTMAPVPAEGRALLNIGKLIDHLKGNCPPPPDSDSDGAVPYGTSPTTPDPYSYSPPAVSEPSPVYASPPPYYAPPTPVVDPVPVYAAPPAGGY